MVSKWIKLEKQWHGSYHLTIGNKVNFYAGGRGLRYPALGFDIDTYDRCITFNLIFFYVGVEVWHKEYKEYIN